ncbi:hypothetical protein HUE61_04350 [Bifidobacterium longum subsp. infantis]|uniref:hypothetical protein n=1 Tax=Bifidobacterium longum TaxID=216816 RepID=UPI001E3CCCE8|nr:hypothetical protein [Bifidobacterium longum]UPT06582.1 hypothetical protein HUE61_04350 [Bifidobacterium longum subsp. infantis]
MTHIAPSLRGAAERGEAEGSNAKWEVSRQAISRRDTSHFVTYTFDTLRSRAPEHHIANGS